MKINISGIKNKYLRFISATIASFVVAPVLFLFLFIVSCLITCIEFIGLIRGDILMVKNTVLTIYTGRKRSDEWEDR